MSVLRMTAIALAGMAVLSQGAAAGWNSGGGELFTDGQNPWFLENTTTVQYCLEIDDAHFGAPVELARAKIKAAIAFWQAEFAAVAAPTVMNNVAVRLGTQAFVETACGDDTDIKIQLGTLTAEQAAYFKYPSKVVGEAVRTDYDIKALRGRGFVYVSPEAGPNALVGPGPLDGGLIPGRWQAADGKLLELVLIHEIGHVFGLPHIDNTIMDASAPGLLVSYPFGYGVLPDSPDDAFFSRDGGQWQQQPFVSDVSGLDGSSTFATIFRVPPGTKTVYLAPAGTNELGLYSADGLPKLLGTLTGDGGGGGTVSSLISLYVTPAQTALPLTGIRPEGSSLTLFYPTETQTALKYAPADGGAVRHVLAKVHGSALSFSGVEAAGSIADDFVDFNAPSFDFSRVPDQDPSGTAPATARQRAQHRRHSLFP